MVRLNLTNITCYDATTISHSHHFPSDGPYLRKGEGMGKGETGIDYGANIFQWILNKMRFVYNIESIESLC